MWWQANSIYRTNGTMRDVTIDENADSVTVHTYEGYGNADKNWADLTGSNDGTVTGSPSNLYFPVDQTDSSSDASGGTLLNPAGNWHNGAETTIDIENIAVGGGIPPIIAQAGTPNDAWNLDDITLIKSGTLTLNSYYQVLKGTVAGNAVGAIFQSDGTEVPDNDNYVIEIDRQFFFRTYLSNDLVTRADELLYYTSAQSGDNLTSIAKYTSPKTL
jgi:hypothetical protein